MVREWYVSPCVDCKRRGTCASNCDVFRDWFPKAWDMMCAILRQKWGAE